MAEKSLTSKPEVWGGIECTINRVGDFYVDQLLCSGHYQRKGDIDAFAQLGIKALRYPVLWEFFAEKNELNRQWLKQQLYTIRKNNITPIAGLIHHGSGPRFTDLKDPLFACKFAAHAHEVASTFPWLEYYTPVNEPLTTARFSGLYGHWFPHCQDNESFSRMLLNQLKATVLAMKAIKKINPDAKLVQTEDLAKIHSTSALKYQARFENERRWLTYDFLCGKVDKYHVLWNYFLDANIPARDLMFFIENPCPPKIIGLNYYVTSERFLDERIERYPACLRGGNGKHVYADIEAVRAENCQPYGLEKLVREVWNRYKLPIALTEVHLNCTREEQMRWFYQAWTSACLLKESGVDIKAVTAWSLLGAYDWNSLLTKRNTHYETGVFDIRNDIPRKTALAKLVQSLATTGSYDHPLLEQKGWWQHHNNCPNGYVNTKKTFHIHHKQKQVILIVGKRGTLANAFIKVCRHRAIEFKSLAAKELNICDEQSIEKAISCYNPWAMINTAGYVLVDKAETEESLCFKLNATGPAALAKACSDKGIKFMTFSSDMVFDGLKRTPYLENDAARPLNVYGRSKVHGEKKIFFNNPLSLVIRVSAFFGPWDNFNFVMNVLNALKANKTVSILKDVYVSPTYIPDLVNASLDLLIDDEKGIWHISNDGQLSWLDFAKNIAERRKLNKHLLVPTTLQEMHFKARRPSYRVLASDKGIKLPLLDNALDRFFIQK